MKPVLKSGALSICIYLVLQRVEIIALILTWICFSIAMRFRAEPALLGLRAPNSIFRSEWLAFALLRRDRHQA